MAFMQRMWNPFAMPMPAPAGTEGSSAAPQASPDEPAAVPGTATLAGTMTSMMGAVMPGMMAFPNPAAMFAALDPVEVERKIGELKVIEGWLAMSLNLMQMSIKTLELQQASLEAMHGKRSQPAKPESKAHKA